MQNMRRNNKIIVSVKNLLHPYKQKKTEKYYKDELIKTPLLESVDH